MTESGRRSDHRDRVRVAVDGEVDLANSSELEMRLGAASRDGRLVVVDLAQVTFFDASGLTALLSGRRAAIEQGGSLILVNIPPFLRRMLTITSLDSVLLVETEPGP
jgi:anti-sigma B factor antagonist